MHKGALIKRVARATALHEEFVGDVINTALEEIATALFKGEQVVLPQFGTFYLRTLPKGQMKFKTKEPISYGAHRIAAFRPSPNLKRSAKGKLTRLFKS